MTKPLLLIGLGGFGKWVVTAFKTQILDTFGFKPDNINWLSLDLIGIEDPMPKYTSFEAGKLKEVKLDYSTNSKEFRLFGEDYNEIIKRVRDENVDDRFKGRMTVEDADLFILSQSINIAAAERRHCSMIQYVLNIEHIKRYLNSKLDPNTLVFLVNSWAGGTGTGIFIDTLLLLRQLITTYSGTIVSIFLLPHGFDMVKRGEDMRPLYANSYAAFREFLRLYYPKGNTIVQHSLTDIALKRISKPNNVDVITDVVYLVDGSKVGGLSGEDIQYYRGTAPAIATFVKNSFLADIKEEEDKTVGVKNLTSFDQGKTHATSNFTNQKAKDRPVNAFTFSSFGSYRLIFDSKAFKTEVAQRIASSIFSNEQFLAPSRIPSVDFAVKDYLMNVDEATKFDKDIVHDCITKGHQISIFAGYRLLKANLEEDIKFPDFNLESVPTKGKVLNLKAQIDNREKLIMGGAEDLVKSGRPTFYAVYNHYIEHYPIKFKECIQNKLLLFLNDGKNTDNFSHGGLHSAEKFIAGMIDWYRKFLEGNPEEQQKALFSTACDIADTHEGKQSDWKKETEDYFLNNKTKGMRPMPLTDPRKKYLDMRIKQNLLVTRDLMRKLVGQIASKNLSYLVDLQSSIRSWIYTFEQCYRTTQNALDGLLEVRTAKEAIVCDQYLTESKDSVESRLFELIINPDEYQKIDKTDEGAVLSSLDQGIKEIITKIPNRRWADFLNGFNWDFNSVGEKGKLKYPRQQEGALVCTVKAGLPSFPIEDVQDYEDYIRTWNYELVENFLTKQALDDLDNITAFEILSLTERQPVQTLKELMNKSEPMLFSNRIVESDLKNQNYHSFAPEYHYSVIADFGCDLHQQKVASFIDSFRLAMNDAMDKDYITEVNLKDKPNEIAFITHKFSMPAPAIENLYSCRLEYMNRLENKMPPPLHVLKGEKEAYEFEVSIAKEFRTDYEELHPRTISLLEDNVLTRTVLWAYVFDLISESSRFDKEKSQHLNYIETENGSEIWSGAEKPYYNDIIYDLLYSGKSAKINSIIDDLNTIVGKAFDRTSKNDQVKLFELKIKEFKTVIKDPSLPKAEVDLFKVWVIMLKKAVQR